jgi:hypothetical protein
VVAVSEDPQPGASSATSASPDLGQDVTSASPDIGQDVTLARGTRLSDMVVGHLSDQVRLTTQSARARRVGSAEGQPGMTDLTPMRELLADLVEEARRVRPRERIARALRQAADIIDPPSG